MKKILSVLPDLPISTKRPFRSILSLCLVMLFVLLPLSGCTKDQIVTAIDILEGQLPQVAQMATGLTLLLAPEYAPLVGPGAAAIAADGKLLESLLQGYNPKTPNPTTLDKINAAYQDIQNNLNAIVKAVGVKDQKTTAIITSFAGLVGLIVSNLAILIKQAPGTTASLMPAVFGFHVSGVDMMAFAGDSVPPSSTPIANPHRFSSRDIATHWNKLCGKIEKAKISVPKLHFVHIKFLPLPFTGKK